MTNTTTAGSYAEQAVAEELARQGYKVIQLNWKTRSSEIDIVAERSKAMYFIEVKYRATTAAGDGFDYITPKKLQHMQRAAEAWVAAHNWQSGYELLAASVLGADHEQIDIRPV